MNMNHRTPLSVQSQITVLLFSILLLLPWLGITWFNSKGEPREAIVAMSILQSGEWILPVNYGGDIPYKPPFLYWLIAIFAKIFNGGVVNEYISRLPSALACIAMVWAGFRWSARLRGERFATIMAIVTLTSVEVFRAAIACRLDMVVTACIVISLYLLFDLQQRNCRRRWLKYIALVLLMTAGTLTKGPIGSLLPCMVAAAYYLLRGESFWRTFFTLTAICVASFIIPALWFIEAMNRGGDSFVALMMEENLGRVSGTMSYSSHVKPIWYNFVTLLSGMAPWTLLAIMALAAIRRFRRHALRPAGLFSLCAAVLIIGFYCIPESKRSVYLLPAYPFIAYAVATLVIGLRHSRIIKCYVWILAILAAIVPLAVTLAQTGALPLGKLSVYTLSWWMWPIVYLPLLLSVAWIFNRRDSESFALLFPLAILLCYAAALQPMVLKAQSDFPLVQKVSDAAATAPEGTPVYSLEHPVSLRFFTLNFYLNDGMRPISDSTAINNLPAGAVVLYDVVSADSTIFGPAFTHQRLTDRNCDHRHPMNMAIKRQ